MRLQDVKSWTPNNKAAHVGLSYFMLFFPRLLCLLLLLHFHPKHQDVQVTKLCIPAYNFTGEHSTTPVKLHCTFQAFSCSQACTEKKKIDGTSFKIFLGSVTRREETCQGSSTELLALLASPTTQPSSRPRLLLERFSCILPRPFPSAKLYDFCISPLA